MEGEGSSVREEGKMYDVDGRWMEDGEGWVLFYRLVEAVGWRQLTS